MLPASPHADVVRPDYAPCGVNGGGRLDRTDECSPNLDVPWEHGSATIEAGQYARLEEAQSAGAERSPGTAVLSEAAGWALGAVAVRTAADEGDILLLVAPFARLR